MSGSDVTQTSVRQLVTGIYDLQKLRIQTGNRIVQQFRHKLGLSSSDKEEDDKAAAEMLAAIRKEYDRLTDGLLDSGKRMARVNAFTSDGLVTNEVEFAHVEMYMFLLDKEKKAFLSLERFLKDVPIFATFLSKVGGCGPAMAGAIICCLDPHKARNVSSFWRYAGLDVGPDGKGRSMRAEHLVDREFIGRDGEKSVRKGITFNKWLKAKLWVLATSFLRSRSTYANVYNDYKVRLEVHPKWSKQTKGHRHNAAMRYMIKMFLADLWVHWRKLEGLEVTDPYAVAVLGKRPHGEDFGDSPKIESTP